VPHLDVERKVEADQLCNRLEEVRGTIFRDRRPIENLQANVTGADKGPERAPEGDWASFKALDRWGGFDQTTWFRMDVTVPFEWKGLRVVALIRAAEASLIPEQTGLSEGGESLVYLNGEPFQGLDRNRDVLVLAEKAKGGERFEIVLEACPSTRYDLHHLFAYASLAVMDTMVWDFYWDCKVAFDAAQQLDQNSVFARQLHKLIHETVWSIDLQHKSDESYYESIRRAQRTFRKAIRPFQQSAGMGKLTLAGHAHIDTAWLWPLRETQRKCARTFSTVLNLMDRYPEFHFSCSQAIQYAWIKEHYPELYTRMKQRIKEGRWELCGAPWVEPDHNIPSGESIVRQYLYGNRFFQAEFGKRSHIAWVPDSFGYTWSLPQIMKKCGLTGFVTSKIDWSLYTEFPYSMFWWEGIDGTKMFAVMPPLNYNGNPIPSDLIEQWTKFKQKELVSELPFAFGFGDGGGGPTAEMIEYGRRLKNMVGVPQVEFGRLEDSVDRMYAEAESKDLPVYNGELYLELHRACQTTQARTKRNNRKCEHLFRDTEFVSCLALLEGGMYEQQDLENAWCEVLTHQFHDILPGTSLTEVFTNADQVYADVIASTELILGRALRHVVERIATAGEGTPIVVFNTLSWLRADIVHAKPDLPKGPFKVLNPAGNSVPHQQTHDGGLVFEAELPPLGYAVYRIVEVDDEVSLESTIHASSDALENDHVRVELDASGCLVRVLDKGAAREVLPTGERANVLQLFDDRPFLYDAWDIDHNFEEIAWEPAVADSVTVLEEGPVRAVVRVVRRTESSTFTQDIILHARSPRIDFETHVDWWEKRTLLKVAFPVNVRSTRATYEIQYGTIERATHRNTPFDRARHEVPAQRWADVSEGDYGVSLLNDCKYGYDVHDNVLRLSLLRSPIDPDPRADEGEHQFTYSMYSHADDWRNGTVQEAAELNVPLFAVPAESSEGALPAVDTFASLDVDHVIIDTVKKHEDSDAIIVRLYESHGQRGDVALTFGRTPKSIAECDFMEENDTPLELSGNTLRFHVTPYEIRAFKVVF